MDPKRAVVCSHMVGLYSVPSFETQTLVEGEKNCTGWHIRIYRGFIYLSGSQPVDEKLPFFLNSQIGQIGKSKIRLKAYSVKIGLLRIF